MGYSGFINIFTAVPLIGDRVKRIDRGLESLEVLVGHVSCRRMSASPRIR